MRYDFESLLKEGEILTDLTSDEITERLPDGLVAGYCERCNTLMIRVSPDRDNNRESICDECLENYYRICDECGEFVSEDEATMVDDRIYCEGCLENTHFWCGVCEEYRPLDDEIEMSSSYRNIERVCHYHLGDNVYQCDECDENFLEDDMNFTEDRSLCNRCFENCTPRGVIQDYHSTVNWKLLGDDSDLRFGFELEVEAMDNYEDKDEVAQKCINIMCDTVKCEYDGSLTNGFEIISHPMTLQYFEENKSRLKEMLEYLSSIGYRSHKPGTCGLHIHVSRKGLGDTRDEQNRVINNVLMLFENFMDEIVIFSRRKEPQIARWAQFVSKYSGFNGEVLSMKFIDKAKDNCTRYMAVNLQKSGTIEFRIFRGTLNYNTFMATMYFVNRIVQAAKKKTINGITWDSITKSNAALQQYCNLRNIVSNKIANEIIIKSEYIKPNMEYVESEEE